MMKNAKKIALFALISSIFSGVALAGDIEYHLTTDEITDKPSGYAEYQTKSDSDKLSLIINCANKGGLLYRFGIAHPYWGFQMHHNRGSGGIATDITIRPGTAEAKTFPMRFHFEEDAKLAYWPKEVRAFIGNESNVLVRFSPNITTEQTVKFDFTKLSEVEAKMLAHCSQPAKSKSKK